MIDGIANPQLLVISFRQFGHDLRSTSPKLKEQMLSVNGAYGSAV